MSATPRRPAPDPPAWFWQTIEQAKGSLERFRTALDALTREQVIQAYAYYEDLARVFSAPLYVQHMAPDMSEDGSFDVGAWVVSQGREYFRDVYAHPEKVPQSETPGTRDERLMLGEIVRFYLHKYDEEMPMEGEPDYES